jgi:Thiol-activated cytolysin
MKKKMQKKSVIKIWLITGGSFIMSIGVFGQLPLQQPIMKPSFVSSLVSVPKVNTSLSPAYMESTKRYMKSATKTLVTANSAATASSTVKLNKGGSEGISDNTAQTQPAQDGAYSCVTRNVNTTADYFRQPMFELHNFIFPGAFLDATDIINNNLSYKSVPSSYSRQPYRISADLFTMTGTPANPTETIGDTPGEDYSMASYRAALSKILNRNANANPPVEAFIEYIEANSKEEVAVKLGYNFKANIPAEISAMVTGIPVGVNANVSAGVVATTSSEKSRLILKINYNFYSVNASPTDEDPHKLMAPDPGNDISNNLVFVSSVLYGTTGYVYFESDKSIAELTATLSETVGLAGPLDQGSASVNISAETKAKFSSTVTKMVAFGRGLGLTPGSSMNVTSLDQLLSLIGSLKTWGPNNQGSPIAYTMQFIKENVQAVVSYNTQFPNKVCTVPPVTSLKFDVDLELDHIDVANINSGMGSKEELYGKLQFTYLKAGTKEINPDVVYWSKTENESGTNSFSNGTRAVDVRNNVIKNLSFDELSNISLYLAGELHDDEGIFASRDYQCADCSEFSGNYGKRKINFIELSATQTAINSLVNNGNYQALKFGGDQFLELNFYESGKKSDGWVKVLWKVWVKPHN